MSFLPSATVVVLNFNGREHLEHCFDSLNRLDYPREKLQVLFADNDSTDGSVDFVRQRYPDFSIQINDRNLGYALAINRAVRAAETQVVALLNNDTRTDEAWLRQLVAPLEHEDVAASASKVYSWDGKTVGYAGGGCNFHGVAFQVGQGEADRPEFFEEGPTLFACGAAMAFRRDLFLDLGGLDDDYFAYYEDVDFGWRSWVSGYRVIYRPTSVVYHHHSATSMHVPIHKLRVLHVRNPLYTMFKNYDENNLARALPAALLVSLQRTWYLGRLEDQPFRIGPHDHHITEPPRKSVFFRRGRSAELSVEQTFPRAALSDLVGLHDFCAGLEGLRKKRDAVQARRKRPDSEILGLFRDPFWAVEQDPSFSPFLDQIVDHFGLRDIFPT